VLNQVQNKNAQDLMNPQFEEQSFENLEENAPFSEKEIVNIDGDKEESDCEEFDKQQAEEAKKTREKKRRVSSGDYIPLQNRDKDFFEKTEMERIYMSGVRKDVDRIKKEFLEEEKQQKQKKLPSRFAEDEEEDEFDKYEKKLLNKVIKNSSNYSFY